MSRPKCGKEEHDAHHHMPTITPTVVALQNDAWSDSWMSEMRIDSQQDDISVDIGIASERNKNGQFKQQYDYASKGAGGLRQ